MADDGDKRKSSWSSWFTPGDARLAQRCPQQHASDAKRPTQPSGSREQDNTEQTGIDNRSPFAPFIAFKHFIDDQVAAVTQFPSTLAELRQHGQAFEADAQQKYIAAWKRWTGNDRVEPGHAPSEACVYLAELNRDLLMEESARRNRHVPVEKLVALFSDSDPMTDLVSELGFYVPSDWLSVSWFKHNPYSPINLEADSLLGKYDTKWRHAFEDLLEASLDKPMTSQEKFGQRGSFGGAESTWRGSGLNWMLSLQCRGILPPQVPSWYHPGATESGFREAFEDLTILDKSFDTHVPGTLPERLDAVSREMESLIWEIATPAGGGDDQPDTELDVYEQIDQHKKDTDYALADYETQISTLHETARKRRVLDSEVLDAEMSEEYDDSREPMERFDSVGDEFYRLLLGKIADRINGEGSWSDHRFREDVIREYLRSFHDASDNVILGRHSPRWLAQEIAKIKETGSRIPGSPPVMPYLTHELLVTRALDDMMSDRSDVGKLRLANVLDTLYSGANFRKRYLEELESRLAKAVVDVRNERQLQSPKETTYMDKADQQPTLGDLDPPQALSTVTTTQTTRLSDGSVQTTISVKRRFADGREETQESTQTSFEEPGAHMGDIQRATAGKKGWFWS